ncbi:MAG TPA: hypothetical protein DCZ23_01645 [Lachnospiraceae bacterium]|nr:hypothetical protein [Lachnospiraceae bacterium]
MSFCVINTFSASISGVQFSKSSCSISSFNGILYVPPCMLPLSSFLNCFIYLLHEKTYRHL